MLTRVNFIPGLLPVLLQGFHSPACRLSLTLPLLSPCFCFGYRYLSWLPPLLNPQSPSLLDAQGPQEVEAEGAFGAEEEVELCNKK